MMLLPLISYHCLFLLNLDVNVRQHFNIIVSSLTSSHFRFSLSVCQSTAKDNFVNFAYFGLAYMYAYLCKDKMSETVSSFYAENYHTGAVFISV